MAKLHRCLLRKKCKQYGCEHIISHTKKLGPCGGRACEHINNKLTVCVPVDDTEDERIISIWEE